MRAPNHPNALRAFEAVARHSSYVAAAEELNVTPAAVGQLVDPRFPTWKSWLEAGKLSATDCERGLRIHRPERASDPGIAAFREWVLAEAAQPVR